MKIAIPTRDCRIDDPFGHCDHNTIYTIENKTIAAREELPSPQGCGCKSGIAADLQRLGVTAMLAGNMGEGAKHTLEDHHIRVIRGCSGSVEAVVNAWLQGALTDSGEACQHHDCPDHHDSGPLTFKVLK